MRWVDALKEWNSKREGKYLIPKKDSAEYLEVKALMGTAAPAERSARKPRSVSPKSRSMSPKSRSVSPKPRTAARPMPSLKVPVVAAEAAAPKPAPRRKAAAAAGGAGAGAASGEMLIQEAVAKMKKGAFTAQAKKHGKEPLEFAADVLANPGSYTETTRKRAQFLMNIQKKTS